MACSELGTKLKERLTSELATLQLDSTTIQNFANSNHSDLFIKRFEDNMRAESHHKNQDLKKLHIRPQEDKIKSRSPNRTGYPNTASKYGAEVTAGFSPHSCHTKTCLGLDCKPVLSPTKMGRKGEGVKLIEKLSGMDKLIQEMEQLLGQKTKDVLSLQVTSRNLQKVIDQKANDANTIE